ncbi:MAG: glycosyltransferase family 39 protein [Nitrososphaerales archaeon]
MSSAEDIRPDGQKPAVTQPKPAEAAVSPVSLVPQKNSWKKLTDYVETKSKSINIGHLLILLAGLHLFAMSFPSESGTYVFDESYYVVSARDLLNLIPNNLEHPFFGKIWGALGIYLFGDNFFGWRILYVVIGLLAVWMLYEVALVFFSKEKSLIAASFLGFETLFFIHTSLALLEGPPIFFALLGFLAYFKKHYYLSALAFGLSILSKEWGIYFVGALLFYHIWATKSVPLKSLFSKIPVKKLLIFIAITALVVSIPLYAYDQVYHPYNGETKIIQTQVVINPNTGKTITTTNTSTSYNYINYPWQNYIYYYDYHSSLTVSPQDAQNTWDSFAWGWIIPWNVHPLPYYVTTVTITTNGPNGTILKTQTLHPVDWLGMGNLVIWLSIWLIVPLLAYKALRREVKPVDAFVGFWIGATYGPSLILSAVFHRIVYAFYFVNVDPGLALGIPMLVAYIASDSPRLERYLLLGWLGAAVIFFILFFPVHPLDFR